MAIAPGDLCAWCHHVAATSTLREHLIAVGPRSSRHSGGAGSRAARPRDPRRARQSLRRQGLSADKASLPTRHRRSPSASCLAGPKRARWHLHLTPTSFSWCNLVEPRFGEITTGGSAVAPSLRCPTSSGQSGRSSSRPSIGTTIRRSPSGTSRPKRSSRGSAADGPNSLESNARRPLAGGGQAPLPASSPRRRR